MSNNGEAGYLTLGPVKSVKPRGAALAIIDDVRSIIAQSLKLPVEKLTPETRLEELGAESLDVIEIVFALEEKYDIAIPLRADEATRLHRDRYEAAVAIYLAEVSPRDHADLVIDNEFFDRPRLL